MIISPYYVTIKQMTETKTIQTFRHTSTTTTEEITLNESDTNYKKRDIFETLCISNKYTTSSANTNTKLLLTSSSINMDKMLMN